MLLLLAGLVLLALLVGGALLLVTLGLPT